MTAQMEMFARMRGARSERPLPIPGRPPRVVPALPPEREVRFLRERIARWEGGGPISAEIRRLAQARIDELQEEMTA